MICATLHNIFYLYIFLVYIIMFFDVFFTGLMFYIFLYIFKFTPSNFEVVFEHKFSCLTFHSKSKHAHDNHVETRFITTSDHVHLSFKNFLNISGSNLSSGALITKSRVLVDVKLLTFFSFKTRTDFTKSAADEKLRSYNLKRKSGKSRYRMTSLRAMRTFRHGRKWSNQENIILIKFKTTTRFSWHRKIECGMFEMNS